LNNGKKYFDILNNHKTSSQNDKVIKRLQVILKKGSYKKAHLELESLGLSSRKHNYNVLKPNEQNSMAVPDNYIHYNSPKILH
jgi:DNA (cytosine-5)-methyltransferase 1